MAWAHRPIIAAQRRHTAIISFRARDDAIDAPQYLPHDAGIYVSCIAAHGDIVLYTARNGSRLGRVP